MLVYQDNPMGVKLISDLNAFFLLSEFSIDAGHVSENAPYSVISSLTWKSFSCYLLHILKHVTTFARFAWLRNLI